MTEVKLEILGLYKTEQKTYVLIFQDVERKKHLEIIIGDFEGQAIALGIERIKTLRPLTHDLFKNFATTFSIEIEKVVICNFIHDTFYAKISCKNSKSIKEIDARVSDAIALAVRFNSEIFINEDIYTTLAKPNIVTSAKENVKIIYKNQFYDLSTEVLKQNLETFLKDENYEKAEEIKKILDTRDKEKTQ
ncbi:MAG: bifunctional nuclease family protein [Sphingobacteriaceae bacterium]|nr:bifunctional nuclease family protein [Sphingobacteriaceae bacterium]